MELKSMEADFENQNFEELDINPYELVIAVSKKAREINSKALKYLGPETEIKPISIALNKVQVDSVEFEYEEIKTRKASGKQSAPSEKKKASAKGDDESE